MRGVDATTGDSGSEDPETEGVDQGNMDDLSLLDKLENKDDKKDKGKGGANKRQKK